MFLKIPYVYDFITKLFRKETKVIQNHLNPNVSTTGQEYSMHGKYKRLELGGGQAYTSSGD
jgi:hypothetical protein